MEERIKIDQLKEALTEIFSEYGTIIEIVAKTNLKAKGQAFIVFDNAESAKSAIEEVNGFELFEKPMVLDFAKTRSDATVMKDGGTEELEAHKRKRLAEKGELDILFAIQRHVGRREPRLASGMKSGLTLKNYATERKQAQEALEAQKRLKHPVAGVPGGVEAGARPTKAARGAGLKPSTAAAATVIPDEYLPPNKILFLRDLPETYDSDALSAIFGRFEGFQEVRLVPGRKGIAFVEYESEAGAISAKEATSGMALGENENPIRVTYQRQ